MRKQELHPYTAVINKKQKNQSHNFRNEALLWLANTFPEVFDNNTRIRPLKIGIMADILAHADKAALVGISKSKLREAVVLYTRRIDYLICLKSREMRVDLEGNDACLVTAEEAERAALKIKKRIEKTIKTTNKTSCNKQNNAPKGTKPQAARGALPASYIEQINNTPPTARVAAVVVKHKTARAYDPAAVARLKEKLGIAQKVPQMTNED